ncbi:hypothetical protein Rs2_35580 [Raphanus sativus]|nr:hypothetical protein Rs2_35580 [Raphanus sativus]
MANGSENLFNRQKKPGTQPSSDSRIGTSIDNHRSYTSARSESDEDCQHQPDEFGILRDTAGRVRAPNGRLLRAFERDIAGIIAITHGSMQQFRQQQAITQPSIDTTVSPLIDEMSMDMHKLPVEDAETTPVKSLQEPRVPVIQQTMETYANIPD